MFFSVLGHSQSEDSDIDTTKAPNFITIENADNLKGKKENGQLVRYLNGSVRLYQDSTYMYCDSAIIFDENVIAYGNVVILQSDTVQIFADSLNYNSQDQRATLLKNVILQSGEQELYTDVLSYNLSSKVASYNDGAILKNEDTEIKSKRGIYNVRAKEASFYNTVSVKNPDFDLWTDSLKYNTDLDRAIFLGPTRIDRKNSKIYCEDGFYDIKNKQAEFSGNAQFLEEDREASADKIIYDGKANDISLIGNAYSKEKDKLAKADKIKYNEATKETSLEGNAYFKDPDREVESENIYYNDETKSFKTTGRGVIAEENSLLSADNLDYSENKGVGIAKGNVVWQDTLNELTIFCNEAEYDAETKYVKAYGTKEKRPILINVLDNDSLFLVADTLLSSELIENTDTTQLLNAYYNVTVYKSDFQATCDSLIFNSTDSTLQFFGSPILWSDTTQFSGDTIVVYLKNNNIDFLEIRQSGFIINKSNDKIFNQIKGKQIDVQFINNGVETMYVSGNAESIYFLQDESKAYIGLNKTLCSSMTFYFSENNIRDIKFFSKPTSTLTPMQRVRLENSLLDGFNWEINKRPSSKLDLK